MNENQRKDDRFLAKNWISLVMLLFTILGYFAFVVTKGNSVTRSEDRLNVAEPKIDCLMTFKSVQENEHINIGKTMEALKTSVDKQTDLMNRILIEVRKK